MKEATTYTKPDASNSNKSGAEGAPQNAADRVNEVDQANSELAEEKRTRATDEQQPGAAEQDVSAR
ncbi:hypothetical protein [Tahibacter harae]|uniref:Uncharacterized protein n=1 Tax=Tahibacter harae TaxID=2963937 RepID=A0ABT1QR19_9GAMM|nr:hypothetical protein [Tahibacter harae]MCQ4164710.1 hypothetical protein [Tahibacter harae]